MIFQRKIPLIARNTNLFFLIIESNKMRFRWPKHIFFTTLYIDDSFKRITELDLSQKKTFFLELDKISTLMTHIFRVSVRQKQFFFRQQRRNI